LGRKTFFTSLFLLLFLASSLLPGASAYTDDNTGEAFLLETDRQVYHGLSQAIVYLNITNQQAADVLRVASHFPRGSGASVKEFSEWKDVLHTKREPEWGECIRSISEMDNATGTGFTRKEAYPCVKSFRDVEVWRKEWAPTGLERRPAASQRIPPKFAANAVVEGVSLAPREKKQYRLVISFPIGSSGEFWIEAEGAKGYGLLDPWWESDWKYRRQINITNNNASQVLKAGYTINLTFDHSSLVSANKSDAYGNDIRIDYKLPNGTHIPLNWFNTTAFNTTTTKIWFKTVEDISPSGTDGNYSLFYGNPSADPPQISESGLWNPPADGNTVLLYRFNEGSGTTVIDEKDTYNASWSGTPKYNSTYRKYGLYSAGSFSNSNYASRSGVSVSKGTVEAWIYPTVAPSSFVHCFFENGLPMTYHEIGICIDDQTRVQLYQIGTGSLTVPLNQWTHVAVTWNGTTIKLYVNGQHDTSWSSDNALYANQTIFVGRAADGSWGGEPMSWDGFIDELRISNSVKTTFPYVPIPEPTLTLGGEQNVIFIGSYQFTPSFGLPNTTFNFSVSVSNPYQENTNVTLFVLNQSYDVVVSSSESLPNGSGNVTLSVQLNRSGLYLYHWEASSSNITGRGPSSGELIGPTVSSGNYTITKSVWGSATRLIWQVFYSTLVADGEVNFLTLQLTDPFNNTYSEFSSGVETLTIAVEDVDVALPMVDYNVTARSELKRITVRNPFSGEWTLRALHGDGLTAFETQVKVD
jgi:hypothetical protein